MPKYYGVSKKMNKYKFFKRKISVFKINAEKLWCYQKYE